MEPVDRPEATSAPKRGFWSHVMEALRGSHHDYTQGSLGTSILLLSVPMVLEMAMESVFAVVDVYFVGRLGPDAVATVGLTESLMTMVYTLAMGLGIGATAIVARRIGEKDPDGAARGAAQSLILGVAISIVISVLGVLFAEDLLQLMGASESVINTGAGYTKVLLGGNCVIVFLFLINAVFRGAGDGAIAMRALWIANLINIVLCPIFIFGIGPVPALGVTGAAVATTLGRGIGAIFVLRRLFSGKGRVVVRPHHFRIQLETIRSILKLSASGTFQVFVGTASWIGLVRIISTFGSHAVAGYTIGIRLIIFALLPSWGLSNAAATMVGQALGAKNPERAEKAVWLTGFYNMCFLGVIGLIFVVFAEPLVSFFSTEPQVMHYAAQCLRTVSYGFLFYAYGQVLTQSFNGAGDTWTPTWISLFIFWVLEIPLAYVLAVKLNLGPLGVCISITIAFSLLAVVSALIFRRGHWKSKIV